MCSCSLPFHLNRRTYFFLIHSWLCLELGSFENTVMLVSSLDQLLACMQAYRDELHLWQAAGAKGLRVLGVGRED